MSTTDRRNDPAAHPIDIRPARVADAAAVGEIWRRGWREAHLGRVPEELVAARTPESFASRAAERVGDTTVALVGRAVAGFVMVVGDEVEQVYVAPEQRGTGVAERLLAEAERQVAASAHDEAWLAVVPGNARARRFYERCGWADGGRIAYPADTADGAVIVEARRYVKRVVARGG
ncbi:MAG TPA: GNAT family N-acetyltransferase [Solirubrobacteraceae bacterium]|nr:GNAT family N-acetyltransferase [Solirubrobacteraceae bacterium]